MPVVEPAKEVSAGCLDAGILAPGGRRVSYLAVSSFRRNVPAMESLRPYSMEP